MTYIIPPIPPSWQNSISSEKLDTIRCILGQEEGCIYPHHTQIWRALELTPLDMVKVVIMGQDPYHAPNQAMGLSFSVPKTQKIPPSLRNIYKELYHDLSIPIAPHGDLTPWAKQGVLLLNTALTVQKGHAGSHANIGWHDITKSILQYVNTHTQHTVFILWGKHAQSLSKYIDTNMHLVLTANHPSPMSANKGGFFGCKHFSKTNKYLQDRKSSPVDWASHLDILL